MVKRRRPLAPALAAGSAVAALAFLLSGRGDERRGAPAIAEPAPRAGAAARASQEPPPLPPSAAAPEPPERPALRTDTLRISDVPAPGAARAFAPEEAASQRARPEAARANAPRPWGIAASAGSAPSVTVENAWDPRPARAAAPRPAAAKAPGKASQKAGPSPEKVSMTAAASEFSMDTRWSNAAAGVLDRAKNLKGDAPRQGGSAFIDGVVKQIHEERKVDDRLRGELSRMTAAGASPAALRSAARAALSAAGMSAEPEDVELAVARATGPRPPDVPVVPYDKAAREVMGRMPDAATLETVRQAEKNPPPPPPLPTGPPPKGGVEACLKYRATLQRALKEYGVQPADILGLLWVETRLGNFTGNHPVRATLYQRVQTRHSAQANRDLVSLTRLHAHGDLGGHHPDAIRGSYAAAFGVPQFLPSSWEAYSRDADGGGRNPFSFDDAILSVANYLKVHGYARDVNRAIYGYNHSQEYVRKVREQSRNIAPALQAANCP